MFAYCNNNPVMYVDPTGYWATYVDFDEDDYDPLDDEDKFASGGGGSSNGNTGNVYVGSSNSGGYSGYTPPQGGGGITDSVTIDGITVTFGHGYRHVDSTSNLSMSDINNTIAKDVIKQPPTNGALKYGYVDVCGYGISYRYFTRSSTLINVGTYVILY